VTWGNPDGMDGVAAGEDRLTEHEIGGLQEQGAVDPVRMKEGGGGAHQLLDALSTKRY
jgi:hypothetical protein